MFFKRKNPLKSNAKIKSIITIDPYVKIFYIYRGNKLKPLSKLTYNKSNFITSYISNKDIIITTIRLSKTIPQEDIADILEIKAYEELGLDHASDYVINFYEARLDGDEREFHIFVVKSEVLNELFEDIRVKTKYIDLILPAPLLYRALYTAEILDAHGVHSFLYFTQKDAFVTFYKDGRFLYAKSFDYSLEQIYEKFCESIGEKVDEKIFYATLQKEGLETTKEEYRAHLENIFKDIFTSVNDINMYVKRAFDLEEITHMFIGSSLGPISGIADYSQKYLQIPSSNLEFNYDINTPKEYIDQLHPLMLFNAFEYMKEKDSVVNLTLYPRPSVFFKRPSGQFLTTLLLASVIGLAPVLAYLVGAYLNDAKVLALQDEDRRLNEEATKYKKIIRKKQNEIKKLNEQIQRLSEIYNNKTKTLKAIYDKKVNYRLKSGIFHQLADELDRYDVHVERIKTSGDTVYLSLISEDDRKITEFIKYISHKHFDSIDQIDITAIQKAPNDKYYYGILKVMFR